MTVGKEQRAELTMFYEPKTGHGLPRNPFKAIVAPRPIGWISTRDAQGRDNLAPYSYFNAVNDSPPQVIFAGGDGKADRPLHKDSISNVLETGVFCVNLVSLDLAEPMNLSSKALAAGEDEFAFAGLEKAPCQTIACARVAAAPAALECRLLQIIPLLGESHMVLGEVIGVHIRDEMIRDGRLDVLRYKPLSRLGYHDYAAVERTFEMRRPE